jgi:hypothetical protein
MLDIAVAYNKYKFLGYEFLTWLWFSIDTDQQQLFEGMDGDSLLQIGNRMVLERGLEDAVEKITIKGDDAGLEEGMMALKKGAMVTEVHLSYRKDGLTWSFNIKGESLNLSSLKLPETGVLENKEDAEGVVLERIYMYEQIIVGVTAFFNRFINLRLSDTWETTHVQQIKKWIAA